MMTVTKKTKIVISLVLAAMIAALGIATFTEVCQLEAVTVNGELSSRWQKESALVKEKSILRQPLSQFVESSFEDGRILKLDYTYSWPHVLKVETNVIRPDCLILDNSMSDLFGLDRLGRVLPFNAELMDWEIPVLTGVLVKQLYQYVPDSRVREVVLALERIRGERINFYRLIEEVDFSSAEHLDVTISGCEQTVRLRSDFFYEDVNRYIDFVARFQPQLEGIKIIDLRQDGQIVTKGKRA